MMVTLLKNKTSSLVLILLIIWAIPMKAQNPDSLINILESTTSQIEKAKTTHLLTEIYLYGDIDSCKMFATRAFDITFKLKNDTLHGQSILDLSQAYMNANELDSCKIILKEHLTYLEDTKQYKKLASAYRTISQVGEFTYEPDSILFYLEKCEEVISEHPDSSILGDVYMAKGMAQNMKGYYQLAIEELLQSARIFEALSDENRQHLVYLNIAMSYGHRDDYEECLKVLTPAKEYFEKKENWRFMAHVENNLGVTYEELDDTESAIKSYGLAIKYGRRTKQPFVTESAMYNLGELYYDDLNIPDSSLKYLNEAIVIAEELDDGYIVASSMVYKAKIALDKSQKNEALRQINQAEGIITEFQSRSDQAALWGQLSDVYEELGEPAKAFSYMKQSRAIDDSLYTVDIETKAEELTVIYETEKKDSEIALLNKQTELDATRKKALWGGMGLLGLLAAGIIYGQSQRRRRIQENAAKEKEIEIEKRKVTEQELEFKKKELTTKALQLASKNEFLNSLEGEINSLKSSVDNTVSKTSQRISRLIHNDQLDDEEWNQFGKEFTSIHQEFLDRLKETHGTFSKSEMRLIALLKMNLSSKDIANTLRISNDGVKKARYRLRKKMQLESNIDIQEYLLSF